MPSIGNITVPPIGLGLMNLGGIYGAAGTDEERFKFLDHAFSIGATHWDTADIYADCEDLLGKWFKLHPENRAKVFLASKFGFVRDPKRILNGDPEYVKTALAKSLERMGIDQLDLYYLHRADSTVPIEKTVGAMAELVKEGKVKFIGLSEVGAAGIRRAHAVHPISAIEVEYSPFALDMEDPKIAVKKTCEELGIPMIAYSPVGRGLLTGQVNSPSDLPDNDWRKTVPKHSEENFVKIRKLVDRLKELGLKYNASPSQISIAWIVAQGTERSPVIPIPGTKQIKYLEENHNAAKIELSQEDIAEIRQLAEEMDAKGNRYPPGLEEMLLVDTPAL